MLSIARRTSAPVCNHLCNQVLQRQIALGQSDKNVVYQSMGTPLGGELSVSAARRRPLIKVVAPLHCGSLKWLKVRADTATYRILNGLILGASWPVAAALSPNLQVLAASILPDHCSISLLQGLPVLRPPCRACEESANAQNDLVSVLPAVAS